jgi:hypothetical protein
MNDLLDAAEVALDALLEAQAHYRHRSTWPR